MKWFLNYHFSRHKVFFGIIENQNYSTISFQVLHKLLLLQEKIPYVLSLTYLHPWKRWRAHIYAFGCALCLKLKSESIFRRALHAPAEDIRIKLLLITPPNKNSLRSSIGLLTDFWRIVCWKSAQMSWQVLYNKLILHS